MNKGLIANRKLLEIKKKYIVLKEQRGSYHKEVDVEDDCIDTIRRLFNDVGPSVGYLLKHLLDPQSQGFFGSMTNVTIKDDQVTLEPSMTLVDNPEDYAVEIERAELLRLTYEWQALVSKKVPKIFIYCKDDKYFVSDVLPEGIE